MSAPGASPTLVLEDVRKQFAEKTAVDGISFSVRPGTIYGLLGRNGAGKTTTLRMIAGIFYPDAGTVRVFGAPWSEAVRDRLSYLPEERGLYKKMTVLDQLLFFAEIKGKTGRDGAAGAERVLRRFELWDDRARKVEELSKGNQQKVQLAGVLVADPELLLLDEPMSGLDPVNVVLVREVLRDLRERGRTIVLSTHMMAEAERLCDEVCVIHRGRVVIDGPVGAVRASGGQSAVRVEFEGDALRVDQLPGVERAELGSGRAELRLGAGADTNALLAALAREVRILRFEVTSPTLEEIFITRVGRADLPGEAA